MVRGVTAIAQCDQVRRVIDPTGATGNQMMNVGFALGASFAASFANVRVASENDGANGAPLLELRLGRGTRVAYSRESTANGANHAGIECGDRYTAAARRKLGLSEAEQQRIRESCGDREPHRLRPKSDASSGDGVLAWCKVVKLGDPARGGNLLEWATARLRAAEADPRTTWLESDLSLDYEPSPVGSSKASVQRACRPAKWRSFANAKALSVSVYYRLWGMTGNDSQHSHDKAG